MIWFERNESDSYEFGEVFNKVFDKSDGLIFRIKWQLIFGLRSRFVETNLNGKRPGHLWHSTNLLSKFIKINSITSWDTLTYRFIIADLYETIKMFQNLIYSSGFYDSLLIFERITHFSFTTCFHVCQPTEPFYQSNMTVIQTFLFPIINIRIDKMASFRVKTIWFDFVWLKWKINKHPILTWFCLLKGNKTI